MAAADAAGRFVDRLPSGFRVGLITFSTTAQLIATPTTNRQAVHDGLSSLRAEGSTAIGDAIERPGPAAATSHRQQRSERPSPASS